MSGIIALITARGGSKGILGKNIKLLSGKPLIAWSIEAAKECSLVDRIIVSTEDPQIAVTASSWGAEIPFLRPVELAGDRSSHIDVVMHTLDWLAGQGTVPEALLLLQPTCPLRTAKDIEASIKILRTNQCPAVVGVCEANCHPFLTRKKHVDGSLLPFLEQGNSYLRRQDLPLAYQINGAIYLNRPTSLRETRNFLPSGSLPYVMPVSKSIDIDTMMDFTLAEALMDGVVHD